jgi:transposase
LSLSKVNPRLARRFAEATGRLAKTDRIDAALLARYGALLEPRILEANMQIHNDLKELHMARLALIKDKAAATGRRTFQARS